MVDGYEMAEVRIGSLIAGANVGKAPEDWRTPRRCRAGVAGRVRYGQGSRRTPKIWPRGPEGIRGSQRGPTEGEIGLSNGLRLAA
jgi:hypothetical protein